MNANLSRRRFITISASVLAAGFIPGSRLLAATRPVHWRGVAMGAEAELILDHPDRAQASRALQMVQDEIHRLEKVFSLFDGHSSLSKLNSTGSLDMPPPDLIRCLGDATQISVLTNGAFDITVQPLWTLYADYFSLPGAKTERPSRAEIKAVQTRIDFRAVRYDTDRIDFTRPGMAITLNGIAQGYITDRVAELLEQQGFNNVLINLGETRGLGGHNDGRDWKVGIKNPDGSGDPVQTLRLRNKAIATSGGYGTRFSKDGKYHHLFDPKTGQSAHIWDSVSVIADSATQADALSTAFSILPETTIRRIAREIGVAVIAINKSETVRLNV